MTELERLAKKHGWPMRIHSRGYDAALYDVQPLLEGQMTPIYYFPGGQSLVGERELHLSAEEFHRLESVLDKYPGAIYKWDFLFTTWSNDWYRDLVLHAMKVLASRHPPDYFVQPQANADGWTAHCITKAVFEEQKLFDPFQDCKFMARAKELLPWYVNRYIMGND